MAIKKREVVDSLTEQQEKEIAAPEETIDERLRSDYVGWGDPVNVSLPHLPQKSVQHEILRRYREAGWRVKFKDDQWDDVWIELS
jgi:hypothetical protein